MTILCYRVDAEDDDEPSDGEGGQADVDHGEDQEAEERTGDRNAEIKTTRIS